MYVIFTVLGYVGALLTAVYTFRLVFRILPGKPVQGGAGADRHRPRRPRASRATRRPARPRTPTSASPAPSTTSPSSRWPMKVGDGRARLPRAGRRPGPGPGRRRRARRSSSSRSSRTRRWPTSTPRLGADWIGLGIGGVDLAARHRHRLLLLRRPAGARPATLIRRLRPLHTLFVNKWYFDEADRPPRRAPGAGDRPLRQPHLRALRRRRPRQRHRGDRARRRRRRPRRPERLRPQLRAAPDRRLRRARPLLPARAAHDQLAALDPAGLRPRRPLPAEAGDRLVGDAGRPSSTLGDRDRDGRSASTPAAPACSTRSTSPGSPGSASTTASASTGSTSS